MRRRLLEECRVCMNPAHDGLTFRRLAVRRGGGREFLTTALAPVGEELFQSFVGQRVFDELRDDLEGHRGNVRARARSLNDVDWMPYTRGEDLRVPFVVSINLYDVAYEAYAVFGDVVEATDEGAYVGRAALGGEYGLGGGEAERDVDGRALFGERARCAKAV